MLLTVSTTHSPATDLGYLLVKHPERVHTFDLSTGTATVLYPRADEQRCTMALLLEVDPRRLVDGKADGQLNQYVNDRPYAASSLLAAALNRVFRTAARGVSKDRPELAATAIPLEIRVPVLRAKGGLALAERLFTPLGWTVTGSVLPLDEARPEWGDSRYLDLTISGEVRLADALNHLYVLLPVLDDAKHYWVAPDEIEKLLRAGEGWLAGHPERPLIIRRYLAHSRALAERADEQLAPLAETAPDDSVAEHTAEKPKPLNLVRRTAVLAALAETGASRVLDLGCGGGALLGDLMKDRRYTEILGADVSPRTLEIAERRLRLHRLPDRQRARIKLVQSALTYVDERLRGYDAAVLMEVIEHLDLPRLPALCAAVFGDARPGAVIVTTPNVEYNVRYENLPEGEHRHDDHRFEWTRAEFAQWCDTVAAEYGYTVAVRGVGDPDPEVGTPTQLALFTRTTTATEVAA
ncbi:3' terminal RNA ribose 2'-O-methyltransferase Hen1 [Catellatospora tritici]|uniref:3' terminal RNA ribose 2'-O-methyltransferase Hen1 n=1 Tax=Catellatospora tritici TaxID=2851566 RepID=UPI001C2D240E|nr:3' terminal RNA ribose 2'-O-methyltransferase Hen1 [Catellatospora tritici]MBV1852165.1 3' terminal RNA ribose 2'-O-methyltransferase Hen1 [Catellatospora tritici]